MTVFVVQDSPGKNLQPAMKFGKLKVLCPTGDRPFAIEYDVRRIYDGLMNYTPNDFILPIGDPVLIGVAVALAAERARGSIQILKYDRQERMYIPVPINFVEILENRINGN